MSGVAPPTKMVEAFGINAGGAYITTPFPVASQIPLGFPGNASLNDGFTPLNMTPQTEGGIPPSGADVNGILFLISSNVAALSAGQVYNPFDSTYAAAIGGYKQGATVASASAPFQLWVSYIDANTTDPATTPANWISNMPLQSSSAPAAGVHADNVLPGPSDYFLDINTAAGAITLNGFVAQRDGQRIVISNTGVNALNLGVAAGTAANQIRANSGPLGILQNDSLTIQYCAAVTRWIVV